MHGICSFAHVLNFIDLIVQEVYLEKHLFVCLFHVSLFVQYFVYFTKSITNLFINWLGQFLHDVAKFVFEIE